MILDEREVDIVQSYYGLGHERLNLRQIGEKKGLSASGVGQLRNRALSRLSWSLRQGAIWPPTAESSKVSINDLSVVSRQSVIEVFHFPIRIYTSLKRLGVHTAHDLANLPVHQLHEIDAFPYALDGLRSWLKKHLDTTDPESEDLLRLSVVVLGIPNPLHARFCNALIRSGIETLGDLVRMEEEEILDTRGIGVRAIKAIQEALAELGLQLAPRVPYG